MLRLFKKAREDLEYCFNIETSRPLLPQEMAILKWLITETFEPELCGQQSILNDNNRPIVEVGPRLNFETAYSTNAVAICHACGLKAVTRLERSRRIFVPDGSTAESVIADNHDRMTECHYLNPLDTFDSGIIPKPPFAVPLLEEGDAALKRINAELGLGFDDQDLVYYLDLFVQKVQRNPSNVELFDLGQKNSEHSRHWFFRGKLIIDGVVMPYTLMDIIKSTLDANPTGSKIAFKDNSSAIAGYTIWIILPRDPGTCSPFTKRRVTYNIIFTAETHNWPTLVAPRPGSETGTGGRIRDDDATGRGSLAIVGTIGYAYGCLLMPDYPIPGEDNSFVYPDSYAKPLDIIIQGSNGCSDYGNKIGEPVIVGFHRSFGLRLPDGTRSEYIKPILFTGGLGQMDDLHTEKNRPEKGMLIIRIGGPAYRIGFGGCALSSMAAGASQSLDLDLDSVQRGDAEMEQKVHRVIRTCVELENDNPIVTIHDQGAGGLSNVLSELIDPAGGKINIRKVTLGDKTMAFIEIWCSEFQESFGLLIKEKDLDRFQAICEREKVICDVVGEVTGDGRVVVFDGDDNTTPVDLDLTQTLSEMPQKTFELERISKTVTPLVIPEDLTMDTIVENIFRLPTVGSNGFLVRKVDRSVTGLVGRQQCCGPLQLPVADMGIMAQSHLGLTGAATSIGEQPIKILVNAEAGARMSVGEALTNIMFAYLESRLHIKSSVNWMWAAKLPGEGASLHDAALSMVESMKKLDTAADGGKDSLSMSVTVDYEVVKSPGTMVISAYAPMPDITKVVTPDIKYPSKTKLLFIDLGNGNCRLGGSALAQSLGQIGDESPDVNEQLLKDGFEVVQQLVDYGLIIAGHDRSDGGLITTLVEMAMSGNCGLRISVQTKGFDAIQFLCNEELGAVVEYFPGDEDLILKMLKGSNVPYQVLGETTTDHVVTITTGETTVLDISTIQLLKWWESTSDRLELEQTNPNCVAEQRSNHNRPGPRYNLTFTPTVTPQSILESAHKPRVAIVREEGSNGDREMTAAFYLAGFEPWDVAMSDLLSGKMTLDQFRGVVFVGGFSYADVLDSAKGWAGIIHFNPKLKLMFDEFYHRKDTFSLGICNGCQLMALLGWVPWSGLNETEQPRFIRNASERFESRWATVKIQESPAIMLNGMAGSQLGIWVAHGEGRLHFPNQELLKKVQLENLAPLTFIDDNGSPTEQYPFNPNGSPQGITALCSTDGRHLAMMPHCERSFLKWQWPWMPQDWHKNLTASPWITMFQNAFNYCDK